MTKSAHNERDEVLGGIIWRIVSAVAEITVEILL
jgi:hypothetical protein